MTDRFAGLFVLKLFCLLVVAIQEDDPCGPTEMDVHDAVEDRPGNTLQICGQVGTASPLWPIVYVTGLGVCVLLFVEDCDERQHARRTRQVYLRSGSCLTSKLLEVPSARPVSPWDDPFFDAAPR